MDILTKCQICGETHVIHLTDDQAERYMKYTRGDGHIQDLLPDLSSEDRERFITGICPECWKKMEECDDE